MKPGQRDRLGADGDLNEPRECSLGKLRPPEIVGEVGNPALEVIPRLWWRAFDPVCYCAMLIRLSIHDRIFGTELPTPADFRREADHERLVRAFPATDEAIEPTHHHTR
jgi:hypothetical protein